MKVKDVDAAPTSARGVGPIGPLVRRAGEDMLAQLDAITREVVDRIVGEDEFYASVAEHFTDEVHRSTAENLGQVLRGLAEVEPLDFDLPRRLARVRAEQGVPLASLLHAYRIAAQVMVEHFAETGRAWDGDGLDVDAVLDASTTVWSLTNLYSGVISQTYEETAADRTRRSERERTLLLDALLEGRGHDAGVIGQASRLLDLPERGRFAVVVAETPAAGLEGVPGLEAQLRAQGIRSAWRLRSHRQVGIVVLAEPDGDAALRRLATAVESRATGRAGVSPIYGDLVETSRFVALADVALGCAPPGGQGVSLYDDHPSGTLIAGSPELAARLARLVLGPLLDLPADERDELLHTLTVWLDEGGSTSRASARLYCHRNTVRNRLQRIERLTDRLLADPRALTELCLAVDAHGLVGSKDRP